MIGHCHSQNTEAHTNDGHTHSSGNYGAQYGGGYGHQNYMKPKYRGYNQGLC